MRCRRVSRAADSSGVTVPRHYWRAPGSNSYVVGPRQGLKRQNCAGGHIHSSGIEHAVTGPLEEVEAAMNISTDGSQCARRGGLNQVLTDWWQQVRSRHELESLDDTILRDIGLSRREERFEQSKPFWIN